MQNEDASLEHHSEHIGVIQSQQPIPFNWQNKWLKGEQYAFILKNIEGYCQKYGFLKYPLKTHPLDIYQNPKNGMIYFVQGKGVGSEFGFPRVNIKKKFRWKKMNFTTDLPKKNPQVTYVVASAIRAHQIDQNQYPLYRMHAVVIYGTERQTIHYILCHVREMKKNKEQQTFYSCVEENGQMNFYKLFSFLHNFQLQKKNDK